MVDELYYPIIFPYTLLGQRQLLLIQEYHVNGLPGAVGEVVIRPMGHGIILPFTDTARCAADVALFYYSAAQDMFITGELFYQPVALFDEII